MRKIVIVLVLAHVITLFSSHASNSDQTDDYLRQHKITQSMINGLADVANQTGYGPISSDKSSWSSKYVFASLIAGICLEVKAGKTSWTKQIARDVKSGASYSQAITLNNYAKKKFCPKIK